MLELHSGTLLISSHGSLVHSVDRALLVLGTRWVALMYPNYHIKTEDFLLAQNLALKPAFTGIVNGFNS